MQLTKEERETVSSFFCVLLALTFLRLCFLIPSRGNVLQSARLMPLIITILLLFLSVIYFIRSLIKARPSPQKLAASLKNAITASKELKGIFLSISLVAIYIFAGIPLLGYYISSALLISFIGILFLRKRLHWGICLAVGLALTGLLYLIFSVAFRIPLR